MAAALLLPPLLMAAPAGAAATSPSLGTAANFAVLGGSAVTNTGPTVLTGDLGVSPGTSITGFPPGAVIGTVHSADPTAAQAQADVATAYAFAAGEPCDTNLTGQDLGGKVLTPGVYCFNSSAQLTGILTLDDLGNPNAAWLFQITSSLTTATNSAVVLAGGASQCSNNITWQVGSSATIGAGIMFLGNILANTSITLAGGANSTGSLYAHTGAVTLDTNRVSTCSSPTPQPVTITTTPSGRGSSGGSVSDSATVTGGRSPTGTVTFTLFGPGDPTCSGTPFATTTGALNGSTATSGDVTAGPAGTYNWVATYNGDANNAAVTSPCGTETVVVTSGETTITSTNSLQLFASGGTAALSSTLTDTTSGAPIPARTVTMTLGSGAGTQSCTAVTDANGTGTCSIIPVTVALGQQPVIDTFAGDTFYRPASNTQRALVFAFSGGGSFVIGDQSQTGTVVFWGAQWAKINTLSGGPAPRSFKGFEDNPAQPVCGTAWTTDPGNSTPPPDGPLPAYMAVIVANSIAKSGPTISGDTVHVVIVRTDPGYAPNPGHPGTGQVVATVC